MYIRATDVPDYWWDGSAPQQLETQKVDLTEYVQKEEGYELSDAANVNVVGWWDDDEISGYEEIDIRYHDGTRTSCEFYNREKMKQRLELKQNKSVILTEDIPEILTLEDNQEAYLGVNPEMIVLDFPGDKTVGFHSYFTVINGDVPTTITCAIPLLFVGDDCDSTGTFTPQPNTCYEVDIKIVAYDTDQEEYTIVARVGAC